MGNKALLRNVTILLVAASVIALPFIFRQTDAESEWSQDDPVLVIITPHNGAIRYEYGRAFSEWHAARYGQPVKVDWRILGGTSEIMRYLASELPSAFRGCRKRDGKHWPDGGASMILDRRFDSKRPPDSIAGDETAMAEWEKKSRLHKAFRAIDDPSAFTCKIDLFFGGGVYDHGKAYKQGLTVRPCAEEAFPAGLLVDRDGHDLIPRALEGETFRSDGFFGTALSTFGICYNSDRVTELGLERAPSKWKDLADPRYIGQIGIGDPTKSGSLTKAFEMIIHEQCTVAVKAAGFTDTQVSSFEKTIAQKRLPLGEMPAGVPKKYQDAVEDGWLRGIRLVQLISANARYFTDSSSKIPIDVSMGNAAAGLVIDFYGRFQSENSRAPDGSPRMFYVTPVGGSSISADPISLIRGAEHRELAVRFITFVLSTEGQKLWNYMPGTPGGPAKFALRRLPIRRDFYPSTNRLHQAAYEQHSKHTVDPLGDSAVNPYELAGLFTYRSRWTGRHFTVHRHLIRVMCLDAGDELRSAWRAIIENGGPSAHPEAMEAMGRMPDRPEPLDWKSAASVPKRHDSMDYMREWTLFFRENYREAERLAGSSRNGKGKEGL